MQLHPKSDFYLLFESQKIFEKNENELLLVLDLHFVCFRLGLAEFRTSIRKIYKKGEKKK